MMHIEKIPTLNSYEDWIEKAERELLLFEKVGSVYDMANCLLTLNALPEWIEKSEKAPEMLSLLAKEKISIMKHLKLNVDKLKENDIDQALRLVRLFCNHAKHGDKKTNLVKIEMSASLPAKFPIRFDYLSVWDEEKHSIKANELLRNIIEFWRKHI